MNLFGKRQDDPAVALRVTSLEAEVSKLASVVRQLEGEQALMHDQVRKWMRRAVAAERNQARAATDDSEEPMTPGTLPARRYAWGARGRRLTRAMRPAPEPEPAENGGANGVHP